jgi:glycosyltransferase involved in cell wall biosynthesis
VLRVHEAWRKRKRAKGLMNIVQITPGAGGMFCGNCFHDNALVAGLRRLGHSTLMVPLYLPMRLDEEDQSAGTPIFFGGINVYLEQKSVLFRSAPNWLRELLDSPGLLKWAAGKAAKTRPDQVGDLTISMLRGEEGNQARELEALIQWLEDQPHPEIICLSNALLVGMARRLKQALRSRVVCLLQGEDYFLDSLPALDRDLAWQTLSERAADVDLFVAPSRYFGELMSRRLRLGADKVKVVHDGINLDGFEPGPASRSQTAGTVSPAPILGYFARMCREKGLDTLIEAFILIRKRGRIPGLKLKIGGGCGPTDDRFVQPLHERLETEGLSSDVEFHPNLSRAAKQDFLRSLTLMSVPARFGESFGLYVIEALASGVPLVQPRTAVFPELIEATGGGVLCEPENPQSLADSIEKLLSDRGRLRALGEAGRRAVVERFNAGHMSRQMEKLFHELHRPEPATVPA